MDLLVREPNVASPESRTVQSLVRDLANLDSGSLITGIPQGREADAKAVATALGVTQADYFPGEGPSFDYLTWTRFSQAESSITIDFAVDLLRRGANFDPLAVRSLQALIGEARSDARRMPHQMPGAEQRFIEAEAVVASLTTRNR